MKIGVICAMESEWKQFTEHLHYLTFKENIACGMIDEENCHWRVIQSGIGKVNAALAAKELIDERVDCIISTGVAGGARPSVNVGDIVVGKYYCYHDVNCGKPNKNGQIQGLPFMFESQLINIVDELFPLIKVGTIATGDWFVQTREKIYSIREYLEGTDILAIDMESAAIAQTCYLENVPFLSVRIISDNPYHQNSADEYDAFWNNEANKSFETVSLIIKEIWKKYQVSQ